MPLTAMSCAVIMRNAWAAAEGWPDSLRSTLRPNPSTRGAVRHTCAAWLPSKRSDMPSWQHAATASQDATGMKVLYPPVWSATSQSAATSTSVRLSRELQCAPGSKGSFVMVFTHLQSGAGTR